MYLQPKHVVVMNKKPIYSGCMVVFIGQYNNLMTARTELCEDWRNKNIDFGLLSASLRINTEFGKIIFVAIFM